MTTLSPSTAPRRKITTSRFGPPSAARGATPGASKAAPTDSRRKPRLFIAPAILRLGGVVGPPRSCIAGQSDAFCEHYKNKILKCGGGMVFFTFPDDVRWNAEREAVEFGVGVGEYRGIVRISRRALQRLLPNRPTPERCI